MSYKLGFEAFIARFKKRFPAPDFEWKVLTEKSKLQRQYLQYGTLGLHINGPFNLVKYQVFRDNILICEISADLKFGIRLKVKSQFGTTFNLYRRPLNLCKGNQYGMRMWLQDKPKFGKLGAMLASKIYQEHIMAK